MNDLKFALRQLLKNPGFTAVAVLTLSYELWQSRFGGDSNIIGQAIRSDTNTFTVVGVLPPTLQFPVGTLAGSTTTLNQPAEIWTPAVWSPDQKAGKNGDGAGHLLARLKAGTTLLHAEAWLASTVRRTYKPLNCGKNADSRQSA